MRQSPRKIKKALQTSIVSVCTFAWLWVASGCTVAHTSLHTEKKSPIASHQIQSALKKGLRGSAAELQERRAEFLEDNQNAWIQAAELWLDVNRHDDAISCLFRAAQINSSSIRLLAGVLKASAGIGLRVNDAVLLPQGLTRGYDIWRFWEARSRYFLGLGRLHRAQVEAERALTLSKGHENAVRLLTQIKQRLVPLRIAARRVSKHVSTSHQDPASVLRVLNLAVQAGEDDLAFRVVQAFFQGADDLKLRTITSHLMRAGFEQVAERIFRYQLEKEPNDHHLRMKLAHVLAAQRKWSKCLKILDRFDRSHGLWWAALELRAKAALMLRQKDQAISSLRTLRAERSGRFQATMSLLQAMYQLDMYPDLRSEATVALGRWRSNEQLGFMHAMAVYKTEGSKAGRLAMQALLRRQPKHVYAMNFIAYSLAEENLELPRAEGLIRNALRYRSADSALLDTLGWILFRRKDFRAANGYLERAVEISPANGELRLHLAIVQAKLSKPEIAERQYELAMALARNQKQREQFKKIWQHEVKTKEKTFE